MKIANKNPYEPDSGFLQTLETALSALKSGFGLNSPLSFAFRVTVEMLQKLVDTILWQLSESLGQVRLTEDAKEVTPIWGKQLHRNWFDDSLSWIPDPLIDERDESTVFDPATQNEVVIISSNPKYRTRKVPGKELREPEMAIEELLLMAETLTRMARGEVWESQDRLYRSEESTPHGNPPEGKRLSSQQYWYWKRRRLQKRTKDRKRL